MNDLYDLLYTHYCKPRRKDSELLRPESAPEVREARDLLLSGEGEPLDREDALDLLCRAEGITAFALGMEFCRQLLTEFPFPRP